MNINDKYIYILDAILLFPVCWLVAWLFCGAITANNLTLNIGWPFCWIGLLDVTGIVLRLTGVIS